jgi:hypothetical protein
MASVKDPRYVLGSKLGQVVVKLKSLFNAPVVSFLLIDAHIRGAEGLDTRAIIPSGFEINLPTNDTENSS